MYPRYRLTVRYGNSYVFDKMFLSLNQLVKVSMYFDDNKNIYMQAYDDLTDRIFSHSMLVRLGKEFENDKVLL